MITDLIDEHFKTTVLKMLKELKAEVKNVKTTMFE